MSQLSPSHKQTLRRMSQRRGHLWPMNEFWRRQVTIADNCGERKMRLKLPRPWQHGVGVAPKSTMFPRAAWHRGRSISLPTGLFGLPRIATADKRSIHVLLNCTSYLVIKNWRTVLFVLSNVAPHNNSRLRRMKRRKGADAGGKWQQMTDFADT